MTRYILIRPTESPEVIEISADDFIIAGDEAYLDTLSTEEIVNGADDVRLAVIPLIENLEFDEVEAESTKDVLDHASQLLAEQARLLRQDGIRHDGGMVPHAVASDCTVCAKIAVFEEAARMVARIDV